MSAATSPSTPVQAPAEPTPADYDPILRDLLNPSLTLAALAARFNTPILSLVTYINRPFIQDALRTIIAATKARAEMLADAGLHAAVNVQYQAIEEAAALAAHQPITADTPPTTLAVRARIREHARKAATTLLRLAKPSAESRATGTSRPVKPQPTSHATGGSPPVPSAHPPSPAAHTTEPHLEPTALAQTVPRAAA